MDGYGFKADMYHLELIDFNVVLGMDGVSKYHAQTNCLKQQVSLRDPNGDRVVHKGANVKLGVRLISALKAFKLLKHKDGKAPYVISYTQQQLSHQ